MYKVILASVLALCIFTPMQAFANPNKEKVVQVQQVNKKKKKKKPAVVEAKRNPFLRCEGFNCGTQPKTYSFSHERSTTDQTAAEFFREDKLLMQLLNNPLELPARLAKKENDCWVNCSNNVVVMEAKKGEGKTAKKDRKELKDLFADNNMPIDPLRIPWCAAFANAILNRSGYETTNSLMARSFLHWGLKTKEPKEGDIVVLKRGRDSSTGHVGFFQGYKWFGGVQYVKVLGGNTDQAVQIGYFPSASVIGYRKAA